MKWSWNAIGRSWNAVKNTQPEETGEYLVITEDGSYQIAIFTRCAGYPSPIEKTCWETNHGGCPKYWTKLPEKPKVLKVFISQPMSGKTSEEIRVVRDGAKIRLCRFYHDYFLEFIESFNPSALGDDKPIEELGKCISLMQDADVVYFAKGYKKSRGCAVEFETASKYGKRILRWSDLI